MSARPQPDPQAANDADSAAELRILSGCHAGARAPATEALRLGAGDDCDIILNDIDLPEGASIRLQVSREHWSARQDPMAAAHEADEPIAHQAWGEPATVGGITLTVCAPRSAWPALARALPETSANDARPPLLPQLAPLPATAADASTVTAPALTGDAEAAPDDNPAPEPAASRPSASRIALLLGSILVVFLLAAVLALWLWQDRSRPLPETTPVADTRPVDAAAQQLWLRNARQALAGVDPALRLDMAPLPDGRIRVAGWVSDIKQLDQVVEALGRLQPAPVLALRTTADLFDELSSVANAQGAVIHLELAGAGRIRVTGALQAEQEHTQVLEKLRERIPAGVDLVDGLRVAETAAPSVQQWLRGAGYASAQVHWDAENAKLVIEASLAATQRHDLERLLASADSPVRGFPLALQVAEQAQEAASSMHVSEAPLPFRIRSVVSGPAPFVVLEDGSKLLQGAQKGDWRLEQINPDTLVFDGPERLVLTR
ncbi:MAG: EscD/YscD/HrpQ family type III secretion system inner membrane ring protein [Comamonas sp. SCN 65-56]|uniref:type III secretion system inner membrane ring subunit SctD n=1 Tax=Comamonas sp. SCN 65-56 TaxID=1660095 RepID=UPI000868C98F|nr:type III secretion system inner membrane ring subunit SctD [Comamonas sp. SCN 65-56]ODS93670.1 MAG: EscD/YscD/HrpQ family type III secretion system inner membrane ring protein [Comamonas sp. SCN 65-56]